ncbi:unnamed protein product [Rhizophagus irregularis]|nr:unnamed protein product [Rhizophagus irregularis]
MNDDQDRDFEDYDDENRDSESFEDDDEDGVSSDFEDDNEDSNFGDLKAMKNIETLKILKMMMRKKSILRQKILTMVNQNFPNIQQ